MINLLDNLLRYLFLKKVPGLTSEAQVRFQPPDDRWRTYVANLAVEGKPANALNIYLADLRENRNLRSNERERIYENGLIREQPSPEYLDCHYLITAWNPAIDSQTLEPTLDEHALLYQVTATLLNNAPFKPSRIYPTTGSSALNLWPTQLREVDLSAMVASTDSFSKLSEFWHSMGQGAYWKPAVYLIVTLPVELLPQPIAERIVITHTIHYITVDPPPDLAIEIDNQPDLSAIGGQVTDASNTPKKDVVVTLVQLGLTTKTDANGLFSFSAIVPGTYTLRAQFETTTREVSITIPAPKDSSYNLQLV